MLHFDPLLDLKIEKTVPIPAEKIWKAWTTPEHLMPWFCPRPWKVTDCRMDIRPGGEFFTVMQGPDGERHENIGCFLELIPNQKLAWTSCLGPEFRPLKTDFPFTGIILLERVASGTKYTGIARHADEATKKQHEEMGFSEGWLKALEQLVDYANTL